MAVDYLKTYLGIDPDDYSSMEARIRGDEPQAQAPVMMQPRMMPQTRSLGEMEAMPMATSSQPTPQVDDRYQSLMDEIASLKAQIDALQTPVVEEAPMMPTEPEVAEALPKFLNPDGTPMVATTGQEAFYNDDGTRKTFLAPPEIQNRMYISPEKLPQEPVPTPTPAIPQAPSQDIQASIDYLAKLPKMNIPQIPDMEQIRQKMEEANMTFPEPVSYQDQLQAIKDLPPMPNNFMGDSARNVMSQIQQPQMQSYGRPSLPISRGFMPEMRADGGGIDKAIYDLKFKLNG